MEWEVEVVVETTDEGEKMDSPRPQRASDGETSFAPGWVRAKASFRHWHCAAPKSMQLFAIGQVRRGLAAWISR